MSDAASAFPAYMQDPFMGVPELQSLSWIVALAIIGSFTVAAAMGANDVANSMGTSVSSRVLTMTQAVCVAAFFNTAGAMLMGEGVSETIRKNIVDTSVYEGKAGLLMLGMMCSLFATFCWVIIATLFSLPVSTTHSIIGAIIGFSLVESMDGVDWYPGVFKIVMSWIASPILAGIFTAIFYLLALRFVLSKEVEIAKARARPFASAVIGCTIALICIFVFSKKLDQDGAWKWGGVLLGLGIGVVCAFASFFTIVPFLFKRLESYELNITSEQDEMKDMEEAKDEKVDFSVNSVIAKEVDADAIARKEGKEIFKKSAKVDQIHSKCKSYNYFVEARFAAIQVFTACFAAFSHGSNDVSNAAGPLSSVVNLYKTNDVSSKANTLYWGLALGGVGISVGLIVLGRKVIETVGHKLTKITPSRGFAVELGTSTAVLMPRFLFQLLTVRLDPLLLLGLFKGLRAL
eukprot:Nk52_evm11s2604 gene=Nk52_evmTU11s2604